MNRRHRLSISLIGAGLLLALGPVTPAQAVRPGTLTNRGEIGIVTTAEGAKAIKTVRGAAIHAVSIMGGTAPCTIIVYDAVNQTGATTANIKWEGRTVSNNETYSRVFSAPIMTDNGIFVQVQGADAVGIIEFE